ncbi:MAG: hypothetical protein J2P41_17475 [Blastocatellia bacterium]|nr:hypothetical protein [Blastocatellia bacterium]
MRMYKKRLGTHASSVRASITRDDADARSKGKDKLIVGPTHISRERILQV